MLRANSEIMPRPHHNIKSANKTDKAYDAISYKAHYLTDLSHHYLCIFSKLSHLQSMLSAQNDDIP